ncbi:hypothetical protein AKJ49_00200 [candidate division MSBL1 archaeon SCGC-AAA382A03]|uniref:PD-(D/E)XK endonuclease-like domain-containing protein n=1 Tax=candidate division MSBL1 archaeon SCGC-AAA382A03 TaxID=1698278 RepID=A0A133VH36_9EURY|nr:hypothetical protein AKJ49_00200 [candidate division MSBL1 archaeon SCGC-AAA382A03]
MEKRQNIYGFLGIIVHKTLEQFHEDMKMNEKRSLKGLVNLFSELWSENWTKNIEISHPDYSPEHFKKTGEKCIENYYEKHSPFNKEKTLGTEIRVHPVIKADGKEYKFQGFIDRLSKNKNNHYIIHDYKTGKRLPTEKDLANDRQLSLYQIGVQQKYSRSKKIELVWHYLRHRKNFKIELSQKNLDRIRNDTISLIQKIEKAKEKDHFPAMRNNGANCDWCDYQELCPEWGYSQENKKSKSKPIQNSLEQYF